MDITAFIHNELAYADSQAGIETDPPLQCETIEAIVRSTPKPQQIGRLAFYTMMATGVLAANTGHLSQAFAYTPEIAELQSLLARRGFSPGGIDGTLGENTRSAIAEAQSYYGLTVDGVLGPETLAALQSDPYVAPGTDSTTTDTTSGGATVIGSSVSELQSLLADRGFYSGGIDGIAGPMTEQAIFAAQEYYGLAVDGIAGPSTLAALRGDLPDTPDSSVVTGSVAELQTLLADRGFYFGGIDGIDGPMTQQAILDAQAFYGLAQDGIAGPNTLAALRNDSGPASEVGVGSIEALQALLAERGFYSGSIDGIEGPRTREAVAEAQYYYGLPVDGIAGPQTIAALTFGS
jgi:peptidoglycan hydrolase-like protein with peptidoglycan-binding domain